MCHVLCCRLKEIRITELVIRLWKSVEYITIAVTIKYEEKYQIYGINKNI